MNRELKPAFPVTQPYADGQSGMTLLEHYAGLAMQGLLSAHNSEGAWTGANEPVIERRMAEIAVRSARALLAEIEKGNTP